MQVIFFETEYKKSAKSYLREWLEKNEGKVIIKDIKYSTSFLPVDRQICENIMVIYEEDELYKAKETIKVLEKTLQNKRDDFYILCELYKEKTGEEIDYWGNFQEIKKKKLDDIKKKFREQLERGVE